MFQVFEEETKNTGFLSQNATLLNRPKLCSGCC